MREQLAKIGPGKLIVGLCGAAAFATTFYVGSSMGPLVTSFGELMMAIFRVFGGLLPKAFF